MAIHPILLIRFNDSIDSAVFLRWLKKEGDHVEMGDGVAEFESDKATIEMSSAVSGKLCKLIALKEKQEVKVGTILCSVETAGITEDDIDSLFGVKEDPVPASFPETAITGSSEFRKEIVMMLNLPKTATDEEIFEAIRNLKRLK
jgi:pyruvate dehydrogenase E2 component (dihydrolipoamide acetyltransferase)